MDNILQEKLTEILELGQVGVLQAVEVLKTQAPEIVRQFMLFETISASAGIFLGIVFLIIGIIALLHLNKVEWDLDENREYIALLIGISGSGIGIIITMCNGYALTKIFIAPNLYIIQNLLQVLK